MSNISRQRSNWKATNKQMMFCFVGFLLRRRCFPCYPFGELLFLIARHRHARGKIYPDAWKYQWWTRTDRHTRTSRHTNISFIHTLVFHTLYFLTFLCFDFQRTPIPRDVTIPRAFTVPPLVLLSVRGWRQLRDSAGRFEAEDSEWLDPVGCQIFFSERRT